jgi:hypothetical protein
VRCTFEFAAPDGRSIAFETTASNHVLAQVGESRRIVYRPSRPEKARVLQDHEQSLGLALFGCLVAAAIIVAALLL